MRWFCSGHVQLAACPTTAAPVADWKEFIEHLPACGLHHTTERKLLAWSVQAACPDCMTARFVRLYGSVCLYAPKVNMLHSQTCYRSAPVPRTFTVHLDQAVGWCAGKADKGGVQAGEAGLQQRCSQLETALLQGLQQVCRLCDFVQTHHSQSCSNGMHTACCCCGCSKACFHLLVYGQWDDGCISTAVTAHA